MTTVGKWASVELLQEGERAVFEPCIGCRFDAIEVRLTMRDYCSVHVQRFLKESVFCRVNHFTAPITIMVVPS